MCVQVRPDRARREGMLPLEDHCLVGSTVVRASESLRCMLCKSTGPTISMTLISVTW